MVRAKKNSDPYRALTIIQLRAEISRRGMVMPSKSTKKDDLVRLLKADATVSRQTRQTRSTTTNIDYSELSDHSPHEDFLTSGSEMGTLPTEHGGHVTDSPTSEMCDTQMEDNATGHTVHGDNRYEERFGSIEQTMFKMASQIQSLCQQKNSQPSNEQSTLGLFPQTATCSNHRTGNTGGLTTSPTEHFGSGSSNFPANHLTGNTGGLPTSSTEQFGSGSSNFPDGTNILQNGLPYNATGIPSSGQNVTGAFMPGTSTQGVYSQIPGSQFSFMERDIVNTQFSGQKKASIISALSSNKGVPSHMLPKCPMVSDFNRNEILSGKNVNFAKLLIPDCDDFNQKEMLLTGGNAIPIRTKTDVRLMKDLTLSNESVVKYHFVKA